MEAVSTEVTSSAEKLHLDGGWACPPHVLERLLLLQLQLSILRDLLIAAPETNELTLHENAWSCSFEGGMPRNAVDLASVDASDLGPFCVAKGHS